MCARCDRTVGALRVDDHSHLLWRYRQYHAHTRTLRLGQTAPRNFFSGAIGLWSSPAEILATVSGVVTIVGVVVAIVRWIAMATSVA